LDSLIKVKSGQLTPKAPKTHALQPYTKPKAKKAPAPNTEIPNWAATRTTAVRRTRKRTLHERRPPSRQSRHAAHAPAPGPQRSERLVGELRGTTGPTDTQIRLPPAPPALAALPGSAASVRDARGRLKGVVDSGRQSGRHCCARPRAERVLAITVRCGEVEG